MTLRCGGLPARSVMQFAFMRCLVLAVGRYRVSCLPTHLTSVRPMRNSTRYVSLRFGVDLAEAEFLCNLLRPTFGRQGAPPYVLYGWGRRDFVPQFRPK